MLRSVLGYLGLRSWLGRRELHEGDNFLTAFRSLDRPPNDCGPYHRGMCVQHCLDLRRVDVLAKANDQFLGSANDKRYPSSRRARSRVLNHPSGLMAAAVSSVA